MLEEKLEKARRRSANRTKKIAIAFFVVFALCGLVAIALYFFDFSVKKKTAVAPHAQEMSVTHTGAAEREEFKEILTQYQNELAPRLLSVGVEQWNPEALSEIGELKKKAVSSFSDGQYKDAIGTVQLLKKRTAEILEESERLLQESYEKAASFLAEGLYEEAKLHVSRALMVAPQSSEIVELQREIEKLPDLLPLLDEVSVARSENNLQKEYQFLQKVIQISPERLEAVDRIEVVKRLLQEQKFEEQISLAFSAVEKRQANEARNHYLQAKKVDPERRELAVVADQLLALEKSFRVQLAVRRATQAVRRDDWQQAQIYFGTALKEAPHYTIAVEGKKRADLVMSLQERFNHFMRNPYRLADVDVQTEARKTLLEAGPASSYSFGIKKQAEQLENLIEKLASRVPVIIDSDNKTYIIVRGVGKVGVAVQKQIELKPGNYIFEGRREGFKSILVRVLIPYDQEYFRLSVICDEPI